MRWLVVLLVACAGSGDEGSRKGDTDTDAGPVWVDADGQEVPGVVEIGGELYFREGGFLWRLDPTVQGQNAVAGGIGIPAVFADPECLVAWAPVPLAPYLVVHLGGPPVYAGRFFAATPTSVGGELDPQFIQTSLSCVEDDDPATGVPLAEMVELEPPDVWWTAPLEVR